MVSVTTAPNNAGFLGYSGVNYNATTGPSLNRTFAILDPPDVPSFLNGNIPTDKAYEKELAGTLYDVLRNDEQLTPATFFNDNGTGLMKPEFINAFKPCEMHRHLCEIWIANTIDDLAETLTDKINDDYAAYKTSHYNIFSAFAEHNDTFFNSVQDSYQNLKHQNAADDLAAYGNFLLATMSFVHGYNPNESSRFLFHNEEA